MLTTIILTIFIIENLLLLSLILIWLNRHCQKCQQVKGWVRIFHRYCEDCQSKPKKKYIDL